MGKTGLDPVTRVVGQGEGDGAGWSNGTVVCETTANLCQFLDQVGVFAGQFLHITAVAGVKNLALDLVTHLPVVHRHPRTPRQHLGGDRALLLHDRGGAFLPGQFQTGTPAHQGQLPGDPLGELQGIGLPDYFISADDVTPKQHVDVQAAAQKWIDSSISKTANVPTDYPYEEFKDIYLYAYEQGLQGCTTCRFNPEAFQGVLVKEQDLENTRYNFTLDDGTVVEAKGNDEIEYDGEIHTAANLFDALKEGYYGKL